MEEFIDFIIGNLVFVGIIVWFLFRVFSNRTSPTTSQDGVQQQEGAGPQPIEPQPYDVDEAERPWGSVEQSVEQYDEPRDAYDGRQSTQTASTPSVQTTVPVQTEQPVRVENRVNVQNRAGVENRASVQNTLMEQFQQLQKKEEQVTKRNQNKLTMIEQQGIGTQIGKQSRSSVYDRRKLQQTLDFRNMQEHDVVQGFIWSEVFGTPRARRPVGSDRILRHQR